MIKSSCTYSVYYNITTNLATQGTVLRTCIVNSQCPGQEQRLSSGCQKLRLGTTTDQPLVLSPVRRMSQHAILYSVHTVHTSDTQNPVQDLPHIPTALKSLDIKDASIATSTAVLGALMDQPLQVPSSATDRGLLPRFLTGPAPIPRAQFKENSPLSPTERLQEKVKEIVPTWRFWS